MRILISRLWRITAAILFAASIGAQTALAGSLETDFDSPPREARPYVWWHWMSDNVSDEGIDKDLTAMRDMGVRGATVCPVGSTTGIGNTKIENTPWPDNQYFSPAWWARMKHATEKANELGLELGMHNCAGWSASGGPWITPELAMQKLTWTKTAVTGPSDFSGRLPKPELTPNLEFYRDIAVLAVPEGRDLARQDVVDLTDCMQATGQLHWSVPAGNWSIYRIGQKPTGSKPHPMPDGFTGLECDKLSAAAATVHMQHVLDAVHENLGEHPGAFNHILFDSYEAKSQDWTGDFRDQFLKRRGYDPTPWLLVIAGRKIGGDDLSRRFQWDMDRTIAELFDENDFSVFHSMLQSAGLQMCFEPYKGQFDTISATALCDVPMGEFWTDSNKGILRAVSAAAQGLGREIVGAEAFTGHPGNSQWNEDPAFLKPAADGALCSGVNQFYLHEWTMQPFGDDIKPGMTAGWWGTHFGRNQTWAAQEHVWFTYLARCSAMLQRGQVVSDFCTLEFALPNGDALSDKLFAGCAVEDGKIIVPGGRSYSLLVLPDKKSMLPQTAEKLKQLVAAGAAVLGPRPTTSPSLTDYPQCDAKVARIGNELWGEDAAAEHDYGKGKVFSGKSPEEALQSLGIDPDFTAIDPQNSDLRSIHRREGDTDIYFVANFSDHEANFLAGFRISGKAPELWNPVTGKRRTAGFWIPLPNQTQMPMSLGPSESVFVVFRRPAKTIDPIISMNVLVLGSEAHFEQTPDEPLHMTTRIPGDFDLQLASGRPVHLQVPPIPDPVEISGPWQIQFAPGMGAPASVTWDKLASWSDSPDKGIKYFSGSADYSADFDLPAGFADPSLHVMLNLGSVKNIAQVRLNGNDLGILWTPPFRVDLNGAIHNGKNHLQITITNTWHNRLIGDEHERADVQWGPVQNYHKTMPMGSPLAKFPDWLLAGKPRPSRGRLTFTTWNYFNADSPLAPAGLIGPLHLEAEAHVPVPVP